MYQVSALEMVGGQGRGRLALRRHIHASIHPFMPHVRMQCMNFVLRLHDTHVHSRLYVAGQVDCSLDSSVLLCDWLWEGRQSRSRPRFGSVHYCPLYLRAVQRGGHRRGFGTCCVKVFGQGGVGPALTERALPGQGWGGV